MTELRFADPWLLLLLAGVPFLALAWWSPLGRHPAIRLGAIGGAAATPRTWRVRLEPALVAMRLVAAALLIVALARPQRGEAASAREADGIDIVLAFDVSSSMTQPFGRDRTRIEAAKDVLTQFVDARTNDRVGLVAFQGSSITLSPLTTDYNAMSEAVRSADQLQLAQGTAIGVALGESVSVLRASGAASRIVILMTDGENNAGDIEPLAAARIAERLGVRVYTVGVVGTTPFGSSRSTLNVDEESLKRIADVTGGTYARAEDEAQLAEVYAGIDELEKSRFQSREFTHFDEAAPFLLAAAAALLALEVGLRATALRRLA